MDRRHVGDGWTSNTTIHLDRELILGTPLFRENVLAAIVIRSGDNALSSIAYPASEVAAAIARVRKRHDTDSAGGKDDLSAPSKSLVELVPAEKQPSATTMPGSGGTKSPLTDSLEKQIQEVIRRYQATSQPGAVGEFETGGVKPRVIVEAPEELAQDPRDLLRKQLLQLTMKQFDRRHQQRLNELKTLEERLASLRAELQKRQELRDEIVRKRVSDLLNDEPLLNWDQETPAPKPASSR